MWKKEDQGQWVALIRFNRRLDARTKVGNQLRATLSKVQIHRYIILVHESTGR